MAIKVQFWASAQTIDAPPTCWAAATCAGGVIPTERPGSCERAQVNVHVRKAVKQDMTSMLFSVSASFYCSEDFWTGVCSGNNGCEWYRSGDSRLYWSKNRNWRDPRIHIFFSG